MQISPYADRNATITESILMGTGLRIMAREHHVSPERIRQIVFDTCRRENPRFYQEMFSHYTGQYPAILQHLRQYAKAFFPSEVLSNAASNVNKIPQRQQAQERTCQLEECHEILTGRKRKYCSRTHLLRGRGRISNGLFCQFPLCGKPLTGKQKSVCSNQHNSAQASLTRKLKNGGLLYCVYCGSSATNRHRRRQGQRSQAYCKDCHKYWTLEKDYDELLQQAKGA